MLIVVFITATPIFALSGTITENTWKEMTFQPVIELYDRDIMSSYDANMIEGSNAYVNLRGCTFSPDGKYAFCGFLNGGLPAMYMIKINGGGEVVDTYTHADELGNSYIKGIASDDRGYIYAALAYSENYNTADFSVIKVDYEEESMTEIGYHNIYLNGTPGNTSGQHVGVNGADIVKVGDNYYLYIVVNYDVDRLYKFDVTDPENPVLIKDFGNENDGYLDFLKAGTTTVSTDGNTVSVKEGYYLDCASDGTIYLGASITGGSKDYALVKIDPNGNLSTAIELDDAYAVAIYEEFAVVTAKKPEESNICATVINHEEERIIKVIDALDYGYQYTYACVQNGILFISNQSQAGGASGLEQILAAPLTTSGEEYLKNLMGKTAYDEDEEETEEATDITIGNETNSGNTDVTESSAESGKNTEKDTESQNETTANTSGGEKDNQGCKSTAVIPMAFFVAALAGCTMVARKKKDSVS